jgi:hypothetical protein
MIRKSIAKAARKVFGGATVAGPALIALCAVAALAMPRTDIDFYDARDEVSFHHPTIRQFAHELPHPDLTNYRSATGPLYHLMLAPIARATGDSLTTLRVLTCALSLLLLAVAASLLVYRSNYPRWGLALCLMPLALSPYIVGPAIRLSTDNVALLFVVASLALLERSEPHPLEQSRVSWRNMFFFLLASLAAAAAVWTRQVHLWLAGVLLVGALITPVQKLGRLGGAVAACLPVLLLAPLVLRWGGLVPPRFAEMHRPGFHAHSVEMELAVLGVLGLFYAPWLLRELGRWQIVIIAFISSLVVGTALLGCFPLPWSEEPDILGGGIWRACSVFPNLWGTTALFWGLVPLGICAVTALLLASYNQRHWTPATALVCFLAANATNMRAYQKYYEPFFLILMAWVISRTKPAPRSWWVGPILLMVAWGAISLRRFVL